MMSVESRRFPVFLEREKLVSGFYRLVSEGGEGSTPKSVLGGRGVEHRARVNGGFFVSPARVTPVFSRGMMWTDLPPFRPLCSNLYP